MSDQDESLDRGPVEGGTPGPGPSEDDLEALRAYEEALAADAADASPAEAGAAERAGTGTGATGAGGGAGAAGAAGGGSGAAGAGDRPGEPASADPLVEIELVRAERDEYLDALRRLQAEFDNYRKRMVRQQTELLERAAQGLVERLLPVLDALDLAVAHGGDEQEGGQQATLGRIAALLADVLSKDGLERLGAVGEAFDPTVHDAVVHVPAEPADGEQGEDGGEPGAVVDEVLRPGYRMKGRVLRPAMVKVRG